MLSLASGQTSDVYAYGKCHTPFMLPMEKSLTCTGACVNEIIPSINRSFVCKAKEGRHVRICVITLVFIKAFEQTLSKAT
jgi:hypothetical protein